MIRPACVVADGTDPLYKETSARFFTTTSSTYNILRNGRIHQPRTIEKLICTLTKGVRQAAARFSLLFLRYENVDIFSQNQLPPLHVFCLILELFLSAQWCSRH